MLFKNKINNAKPKNSNGDFIQVGDEISKKVKYYIIISVVQKN
jgi:hypothetical protein